MNLILLEIITSIGLFGIIVCLSLIFWALRQLVSRPIKEALDQSVKATAVEVEQAKRYFDYGKVETRMEPKKTVSSANDSLDKIKALRRKK